MASEKINNLESGIQVPHIEESPALDKEKIIEPTEEKLVEAVAEKPEVIKTFPISAPVVAAKPVSPTTDDYHLRREIAVDNILSEGLGETFLAMSPAKQKLFKEEGEKTVKKINILLDATKVNVNKIVTLIRKWLSIIPGVNRFFLDQEAKIKTDNIIKIKNKL
jgi:hypothetical protein